MNVDQEDAAQDFAREKRRQREQEQPMSAHEIAEHIKKDLAQLTWLHSQRHQSKHPRVWEELIADVELRIERMDRMLSSVSGEPMRAAAE